MRLMYKKHVQTHFCRSVTQNSISVHPENRPKHTFNDVTKFHVLWVSLHKNTQNGSTN